MNNRKMLLIDFETRSRVDLKTAGADIYCKDPSTEVLCCAFYTSEVPINRVEALDRKQHLSSSVVSRIKLHIANGGFIGAWNARFDQQIWEYCAVNDNGFPEIPAGRWYCVSAQARVNALPAGLDDCTRAFNSTHKKDHIGTSLIRKLSIPSKDTGEFNQDRALHYQMRQYCKKDVEAMNEVYEKTSKLTQQEHTDWLINERINDRGLRIDIGLATAASSYAAEETANLSAELTQLTNGVITKHTQTQRIKKWVLERVNKDAELLTVTYADGERKNSLAKDIRANLLDQADSWEIELPDEVYNVIAALDEGNMSSVSKFKRMVAMADPVEDRVRGSLVYAGASTLRYASRGLQIHNMTRDCESPEAASALRALMVSGSRMQGDVMKRLSRLLRPSIIPKDHHSFVVGDWKSIENMVLPWLSADPRAEDKLDLFRQGEDTYVKAAEDAQVTDYPNARQIGKVIELSLGFGGANGAFNGMAKNYGVHLPEDQVTRIVKAWRINNPWAERFWNKLDTAATRAVINPGFITDAGRVSYMVHTGAIGKTLLCTLPGGTVISYPDVRYDYEDTPFGRNRTLTAMKANWKPAQGVTEWPRFTLWRGLLAENVTQAFAAALLRDLLTRVPDVVLHCHDEVALEVPDIEATRMAVFLKTQMETVPPYAKGLPLSAPVSIVKRYGK